MDIIVQPLTRPPQELVFHAVEDNAVVGGTTPGEVGFAAPWMTLAAVMSMRLYVRNVSLDPAKLTFVDMMVRMGVRVREEVASLRPGGWMGLLDVHPSRMRGITLPPALLPRILDEIPLLAVLAAFAEGTTTVRGACLATGEYRDLCRRLCANLRALRAEVKECPDGFVIQGGGRLRGGDIPAGHDSRIGMALVIAGLAGDGECLVRDVDATVAGHGAFFKVFAAQFQRLPANPPPAQANSTTGTRCCAGAVRSRLRG